MSPADRKCLLHGLTQSFSIYCLIGAYVYLKILGTGKVPSVQGLEYIFLPVLLSLSGSSSAYYKSNRVGLVEHRNCDASMFLFACFVFSQLTFQGTYIVFYAEVWNIVFETVFFIVSTSPCPQFLWRVQNKKTHEDTLQERYA